MLADRAIGFLAFACAVAVANAYYIQPLLVDIGAALSIAGGLTSILPALSQAGLALGLLFLLPLGDIVSTRRLLLALVPAQIAALILFALSGSLLCVGTAALLVGLFGITPYVLPPFASLHVPASRLGHVTGILSQGVVIGILLARTLSGIVGTQFGWRTVYGLAAVAMSVLLVILMRIVRPESAPPAKDRMRYWKLIASLFHLLRTEPALRTAALCQALSFGSFNVFWLGLTLYLQSPRFGWSAQGVGFAALLGAAAAGAAPLFGRLVDSAGPHKARRIAMVGMAIAWVVLVVFDGHLPIMAVGLVILDLGATVGDISNRTILYGLDRSIRTRLNAVYQVAMFTGGAIASMFVGIAWMKGGWLALCILGIAPILLTLIFIFYADRQV